MITKTCSKKIQNISRTDKLTDRWIDKNRRKDKVQFKGQQPGHKNYSNMILTPISSKFSQFNFSRIKLILNTLFIQKKKTKNYTFGRWRGRSFPPFPLLTPMFFFIFQTSSAGAEISDGPHKGGGRRKDGPNDIMFVNNLIQKDLSISILFVFFFLFCQSCFLFFAT